MNTALYPAWPAGARRTWALAALALPVAGYLISAFPLVIGIGAFTAFQQARTGADPLAVEAAVRNATLTLVMPLLLAQFSVWTILTLVWARRFERRGLDTLGLRISPALPGRYLLGMGFGLVLLIAIGVIAGVLGDGGAASVTDGTRPQAGALTEILSRPGVLAGLGLAIVVFLIQGGSEEVVFRGWLMSTLAARWGVRAAVIVSSAAFMLFHVHVFVSGLWFGVAALAGIGLMGLVFALLSLLTRSVWEAVAAHGAFNAAAVTGPTLAVLAADPQLDVSTAFAQVFEQATGMAGPDAVALGPETFAQAAGAGVAAAILAVLVGRRTRRT